MTTWVQWTSGWHQDQTALGNKFPQTETQCTGNPKPSCVLPPLSQPSSTKYLLCSSHCFSLNSVNTPCSHHFLGRARLKLWLAYKQELLGLPQGLWFSTTWVETENVHCWVPRVPLLLAWEPGTQEPLPQPEFHLPQEAFLGWKIFFCLEFLYNFLSHTFNTMHNCFAKEYCPCLMILTRS